MKDIKELKSELGFLIDDLKQFEENESPSPEEKRNVDSKIEEIEQLQSKIKRLEKLDEFDTRNPDESKLNEQRIEDQGHETSGTFTEANYRSFGEQLQMIAAAGSDSGQTYGQYETGKINRSLYTQRAATGSSEDIPSQGGFAIGVEYANEFLSHVHDQSVLLDKCRQGSLSGNATSIKIPGVDESSRVDGSRWGGIRVYRTDEAAQMTSSKPKIKQVQLTLNKLTGLWYATDELLQDAALLGRYVMETFPLEFAFKIDDEIFDGTGAGECLGVKDCNAAVSITKETSQTADTLVVENFSKMFARMWAPGRRRGIWAINASCIPQIIGLSQSVGTGGGPIFMTSGVQSAPNFSIYGRPIHFIEQAKALGEEADVMFLDMSQYMFIDKGGIQSASSIHLRFDYNETAFRWVWRCDGQPLWTSALTPYQGSDTQSPFIKLGERA